MSFKPRDTTVPSPCVSVCALDENDVCIGCHRSTDEIAQWAMMTAGEKRSVLAVVAERERAVQLSVSSHSKA